jgi:protein MPE1
MTAAEVRATQPHDAELACPICKHLIWDAVKTPCCSTSFCEECIQDYLIAHDFVCESCESKVGSLEELTVNEELRERVKVYMEAEIDRSKKEKAEEDEQAGVASGQAEGSVEGESAGEASGTQDQNADVEVSNESCSRITCACKPSLHLLARTRYGLRSRSQSQTRWQHWQQFYSRSGENARNDEPANDAAVPVSGECL